MKRIIIFFTIIVSVFSLQAQTKQTYTEAFDSTFRNINRTQATTGILYESKNNVKGKYS